VGKGFHTLIACRSVKLEPSCYKVMIHEDSGQQSSGGSTLEQGAHLHPGVSQVFPHRPITEFIPSLQITAELAGST